MQGARLACYRRVARWGSAPASRAHPPTCLVNNNLQGYHGERASSFALLLERQQAAAAAEQAEAAAREAAARLRAAQA